MMFSERLEHGKYDFQHLQGTVRAQKPAQFRWFSEDKSLGALYIYIGNPSKSTIEAFDAKALINQFHIIHPQVVK